MGHLDAQKYAGAFYGTIGVTGSCAAFTNVSGTPNRAAVTDVPTSGQYLVIEDLLVSAGAAMAVDFEEETTTKLLFRVYLPANGTFHYTPKGKNKLHTADKRLMVKSNAVGNVAVTTTYFSEA